MMKDSKMKVLYTIFGGYTPNPQGLWLWALILRVWNKYGTACVVQSRTKKASHPQKTFLSTAKIFGKSWNRRKAMCYSNCPQHSANFDIWFILIKICLFHVKFWHFVAMLGWLNCIFGNVVDVTDASTLPSVEFLDNEKISGEQEFTQVQGKT